MSCNPKPQVTCGDLIPDTCIPVQITWPACYTEVDCPRQSDFNSETGYQICAIRGVIGSSGTCVEEIYTDGTGILGNIYLKCLGECDDPQVFPALPITVTGAEGTVREEFQNVYGNLCKLNAAIGTFKDYPVASLGLTIPDCLQQACCSDPAITTLGPLLQAMMDKICCIAEITSIQAECPNPNCV
jgi:hypothetical protein